MSNIRSAYGALADISMNFTNEAGGTTTVTADDLHELKDHYEAADLPKRVLLPTQEYNNNNPGAFEMGSAGTTGVFAEMMWAATDLLLFEEAGLGLIEEHLPDMVRYAGNYIETIQDNRAIATNIEIMSHVPLWGTYEYPVGSGQQYHGVEIQIVMRELINP